jgi:uncharacterized cupin superfamily protein
MSTFVHATPSTISGELEPTGPVPNADSGDPQASVLRFDMDGTLRAGIWECQPGGWSVENREATETCYILSGLAVVTDAATGERYELSSGDGTNAANTATMIAAAAVMTRPVLARPPRMACSLLRVRSQTSRIRLTRKTS